MWVTASPFLAQQIKRDVKDVGLKIRVHELSSQPLKGNGNIHRLGPGLMITTYRTLIGSADDGTTRIDQLISWLGGEDWDGVLALDEAHKVGVHCVMCMVVAGAGGEVSRWTQHANTHHHPRQAKNLKTVAKKKGGKGKAAGAAALSDNVKASKTAMTIYGLQQTLRNARVVYSSATIATKCVWCWPLGHAFGLSMSAYHTL